MSACALGWLIAALLVALLIAVPAVLALRARRVDLGRHARPVVEPRHRQRRDPRDTAFPQTWYEWITERDDHGTGNHRRPRHGR